MYYKNDDVCGCFYVALRSNFDGFWLQLGPQDGLINGRRGAVVQDRLLTALMRHKLCPSVLETILPILLIFKSQPLKFL